MIFAEMIYINWNKYINRFQPSVFDYIMSVQFYFLSRLEDEADNFDEFVKDNFFRSLNSIINNELKMYPKIDTSILKAIH